MSGCHLIADADLLHSSAVPRKCRQKSQMDIVHGFWVNFPSLFLVNRCALFGQQTPTALVASSNRAFSRVISRLADRKDVCRRERCCCFSGVDK